jgi:thymidylate synthase ThyX
MTTKKEVVNPLIKEARSKIKMTDAAIEVALANREGFFNPIQSVQVKSTRFTLEKVVELVKANNEIIYDQCSTPNTGIYVIKYLPPANVVEGLRKEFLSNYKKELKAQQAKELEKIINGLTLEYAAKLELKAEKEKQEKLDKAKADLLQILSGEVIAQ